jgi:hypothetical protein
VTPTNPVSSAEFTADLAEVAAIVASLTSEQRAIALGWAHGGGTYAPVGYWNELASTYVAADGLDEAEAARVFGLVSAEVFDALITTFGAKYHYWLLRPHQAAASARVLAHFFPHRAAELNEKVATVRNPTPQEAASIM